AACELFGRGVLGCQGLTDFTSQVGGLAVRGEQRGDSKVEQLNDTCRSDENVGRLQVPMHDQAAVSVCHCCEHVQEQPDAGRYVESHALAMCVDAFSTLH